MTRKLREIVLNRHLRQRRDVVVQLLRGESADRIEPLEFAVRSAKAARVPRNI